MKIYKRYGEINPPETYTKECKYCEKETTNGSICKECLLEQKADEKR
jgi:hypothetical protein